MTDLGTISGMVHLDLAGTVLKQATVSTNSLRAN
jgi:hypothetical protein